MHNRTVPHYASRFHYFPTTRGIEAVQVVQIGLALESRGQAERARVIWNSGASCVPLSRGGVQPHSQSGQRRAADTCQTTLDEAVTNLYSRVKNVCRPINTGHSSYIFSSGWRAAASSQGAADSCNGINTAFAGPPSASIRPRLLPAPVALQ